MKLHKPTTRWEAMIFNALSQKLVANHRKKKPSKRDEIREWNKEHHVQLKLRPSLGKASLYRDDDKS